MNSTDSIFSFDLMALSRTSTRSNSPNSDDKSGELSFTFFDHSPQGSFVYPEFDQNQQQENFDQAEIFCQDMIENLLQTEEDEYLPATHHVKEEEAKIIDFNENFFKIDQVSSNENSAEKQRPLSKGKKSQRQSPKTSNKRKPQNFVDFDRILKSYNIFDEKINSKTTLMLKNVPNKLAKDDLLSLIDQNFAGYYNFFYLPMDIKNKCNLGFAFINFTHPLMILDFYLNFNFIQWQDFFPSLNSQKRCQIVYSNIQGVEPIMHQLRDTNVMKRGDKTLRPVTNASLSANQSELDQIYYKYSSNPQFENFSKTKLNEFKKHERQLQQRGRQNKKENNQNTQMTQNTL